MINDPNGKPRKITIEVEDITPEKAEKYLGHNFESNRNISRERVDAYKRDMEAHEWEFTGQTVVFDEKGRLVDGQHRLHAIVKSGESIRMIIVRGVSPDAVNFIDKNRVRSFRDTMKITKNETVLRFPAVQSAINSMIKRETPLNPTESEKIWLFSKFEKECNELERVLPHTLRKPITADFRGACLGALIYGVPMEDIAEFVKVIRTRTPSMKYNDESALKWEDAIHKAYSITSRGMDTVEMYFGTQNALYYFLKSYKYKRHKELKKWFPIKDKLIEAIQDRGQTTM